MKASSSTCLVRTSHTLQLIYLSIGEPSKERFEGVILSDASTESNFIRSNGVFTAVCNIFELMCVLDSLEERWWRCDRRHEGLRL